MWFDNFVDLKVITNISNKLPFRYYQMLFTNTCTKDHHIMCLLMYTNEKKYLLPCSLVLHILLPSFSIHLEITLLISSPSV